MTNPLIIGAIIGAGLDAFDSSDVVDGNILGSVVDGTLEGAAISAGIGILSSLFDD